GQALDRSTRVPTHNSSGSVSLQAAPTNCSVLWDITHGELDHRFGPDIMYSAFVNRLAPLGISVATTSAGVQNIDLSPYGVLVVDVVSNWNSAYTPAEVAAIAAFTAAGGRLLVMSDCSGCNSANIQAVSQLFGTTVGASDLNPPICEIT